MFVMLSNLAVTCGKVGKGGSDIAAVKNGQVGSNFAALKKVKLAASVKSGKVGSHFGSLVCDICPFTLNTLLSCSVGLNGFRPLGRSPSWG